MKTGNPKKPQEAFMDCPNCQGFEEFDRENAEKDIDRYRTEGPNKKTQILLDALRKEKLECTVSDKVRQFRKGK